MNYIYRPMIVVMHRILFYFVDHNGRLTFDISQLVDMMMYMIMISLYDNVYDNDIVIC